MPLTPGTRLGPYEILAALGAGGMGEVYRARDPRLRRDVAIKTLPLDFAHHPDRLRRFEQEARAIAALSHPNLLAVFDVGRDGAVRFLVTELLEGETLRERLASAALDLASTLDLGRQLAAGLGQAHARGVVHRDLKPENIFLTAEGFAKVLDFGLARIAAEPKSDENATRTASGVVVGTLAYMAPEQRSGLEADERTDVYAVGAVLFEALSGQRASEFSVADTLSTLLYGRSAESELTAASLSGPIGAVVCRCLEKDPAHRYQSMSELRAALDALVDGHTRAPVPGDPPPAASVAVLPFNDSSSDRDQAYFCEGMAEEIINVLARVDGLHVAARTSTFQMKAQGRDLGAIAKALHVRTVLEGSVRTSGRRLRVTAQLADASTSTAIWSDRYDGDAEDVFDIQDRIATAIASALRVKLLGDHPPASPTRQTSNLDAYHAYLKGRHHRLTTYDLLEACRAFSEAAALDPAYAPAHAGAAHTLVMLGHYGFIPPQEARSRAIKAIDRALAVNPRLPQALAARAYVLLLFERQWMEAETLLNRALDLDPGDVDARVFLAYLYVVLGRAGDAAAEFARARALEPFSAWTRAATGMGLLHVGDFDAALDEARHALEARPDSLLAQAAYGAALTFLERPDEGIPVLERAVAAAPAHNWLRCWLGIAYGTAGRVAEAEGVMKALADRQLSSYVSPGWLALVPASLGRVDEALGLLDLEIKAGGSVPTFLRSPVIQKLRASVKYHDMLQRLRLPPL